MNKEWHAANLMPRNPTKAQRIKWHQAHQQYCACCPVPEKLRQEVVSIEDVAIQKPVVSRSG